MTEKSSPAGLFEAHLAVSDLSRAVAFYRDVVGLELAFESPAPILADAAPLILKDGKPALGILLAPDGEKSEDAAFIIDEVAIERRGPTDGPIVRDTMRATPGPPGGHGAPFHAQTSTQATATASRAEGAAADRAYFELGQVVGARRTGGDLPGAREEREVVRGEREFRAGTGEVAAAEDEASVFKGESTSAGETKTEVG